jgi:GNAT superfamily N-acetyltransferase
MGHFISTDKSKLDVDAIHDYLCNRSYWAKGRSRASVEKSIANSTCFGLYDANEQMLGFARVVTDQVVFAYLMDLFVLEGHQHKGLGTMLVRHILEHPDFQVRLWFLATKTAHGLYEKFGFSRIPDPDRYMFKRDENRR